jgi:micrococcal nuclease
MAVSSGKYLPIILIVLSFIIFFGLFSTAQRGEDRSITRVPITVSPSPTIFLSPTLEEQVLSSTESIPPVPVVKVVDGDTIAVVIDGKRETVRLIGINTPETVDPRRPVECFGKEASDKVKSLLTGTSVRLVSDPTQSERDRYNRLLRYVYLDDGRLFNQYLIEEGFAYEYTYGTPYEYREQFKTAEKNARENQRGLWSESTCSGAVKQNE